MYNTEIKQCQMIRRFFAIIGTYLFVQTALWANGYQHDDANSVRDSIPFEFHFSNFDRNLDSLMRTWFIQEALTTMDYGVERAPLTPIQHHDSIYIQRLANIPSVVPLTFNSAVRSAIHVYTMRRHDQMEVMLGLSEHYFPMFKEIFDYYQVPLELKYLAVIESALNPTARSRVGATGMWQFMLATGRQYNLPVTSLVDMRRDPVAATHAAARFLRDLHNIYNCWTLALAAYNCGPGNVNRAIRRAGGRTCYWEIHPFLPRETRMFIPLYIGATYAFHYHREYGFIPRLVGVPPVSDTIMVNRNVNLAQVAAVMDIPLRLLRDLNPQYLRDIVPANHPLRLPIAYMGDFIDMEEAIVNHRANVYLASNFRPINPAGGGTVSTSANTAGRERVVHTIRSGETLSTIASRYRVTVANLQAWNNLSGTRIVAGRQLVVWVLPTQTTTASNTTASTTTQTTPAATSNVAAASGNVTYHTVMSGDTIWGIAQQYNGVSVNDLLSWNNLRSNSVIRPGMRLRIVQ